MILPLKAMKINDFISNHSNGNKQALNYDYVRLNDENIMFMHFKIIKSHGSLLR